MFTKRQANIIENSIQVIAKMGIQGFTIRNLAHNVGVTESAIYRHFESKVSILAAILKSFEAELSEFIEQLSLSSMGSIEKIEYVYESHITRFRNNPALVSILFAEEIFKNERELSERTKKILDINHNNFRNIIEEGQKEKEIRDDLTADQLAMVALATIRLCVKQWELSNYTIDLSQEESKIKESIRVLFKK
jgi:AcrR family transcriptional regulator